MALSPISPDYVSQVRGIIGDLRENYLKKQQLFQQDEQEKARLNLSYAQLAAQQDNAQQQAGLEARRLEAAQVDNQRQLEQFRSGLAQKQFDNELQFQKFNLDQQKELNQLQAQKDKEEKDKTASVLEQKFRIAQLSGDNNRVAQVMDEIGQANLDRLQRASIYDNVYGVLQKNRELEQVNKNLETASVARDLTNQLNSIHPRDYTPDQYITKMNEIQEKFNSLGNTDPRVNEPFTKILGDANRRLDDYRKSIIGEQVSAFQNLAEQGQAFSPAESRLGPKYQEAYNKLKESGKLTNEALQGLVFQRNKEASINELRDMDRRLSSIGENLSRQNPDLAIVQTDPATGETYRTFTYPIPDLSPKEGFNANIDPETGLVTKAAYERAKKWEDEVTSPQFLTGQVPFIRQFQTQQVQAPAPKAGEQKATAQATALPFRSGSRFDIGQPGTATIPTVANAPAQIQISPDTVSRVVEAYNSNPDGTINGRPAREVVARLMSAGISLPGLRQAPPSNVVTQGQKR